LRHSVCMKRKSLILCVAALVGFATLNAQDQSVSTTPPASNSTGAEKQQHGWGRHHRFAHLLKQLNLTADQKQHLKQYFSDNKQTFRSNRLNLLKAKQAVDSAMEKNPSDDATIRSLSGDVASARTEVSAQRAKFAAYLQSILTSEQKQTLAALRQKRDARLQARIDRLS
jgi:Spy/CpxP family protein refolding chaperone